MLDFLDVLARDALASIEDGYYEHPDSVYALDVSLQNAILKSSHVPIIAEIKGASPSLGVIREDIEPEKIASAMAKGGATGISVLTESKHFKGSLSNLTKVRKAVKLPILMKDIILNKLQLEAAARTGANAVILIQALYDRGYGEFDVDAMIAEAHARRLEVLLEVHEEDEFQRATDSAADLVGINNRNLGTLKVDLNITKRILTNMPANGKIVVSESGILTNAHVRFLRDCGSTAFLIGSAVMSAEDVESKVREFTRALRKDELKV